MIAGGGVLAAILMVMVSVGIARSRGRSLRMDSMIAHRVASEHAESLGLYEEAFDEIEKAVTLASRLDPGAEVATVKAARSRIALLAIEVQLKDAENTADPVATLRAIRDRVESDRTLETARESVLASLAESLEHHARVDLAEAQKSLDAGNATNALNLCERVARSAEELGFERASSLKEAANVLVREIVARVGVSFSKMEGEFLDGPGAAAIHAASLQPIVIDALRARGYLPKPTHTAFASAWDSSCRYVFGIEIIERDGGLFFQTPLHTARLNSWMTLKDGTKMLWQSRPNGKTRVPPPMMSAFESSRLSLVKTRDPDVEKKLYDDARFVLAENTALSLKNLPAP